MIPSSKAAKQAQHRSRTPNSDLERILSHQQQLNNNQNTNFAQTQLRNQQQQQHPADCFSHEVDTLTRRQLQQNNTNDFLASSRSFGQHDSRAHELTSSSGRYRSRTPGPDFMRSRERDDDQTFMTSQRGREPTRSKTPTSELFKKQTSLSGTPDFIPASRYESPARSHDSRTSYGRAPSEYPDGAGRVTSAQAFAEHAHKSYANPNAQQPFGSDAMRWFTYGKDQRDG